MAKKKSYDETSVIRNISRRKGININYSSKVIEVHKDATDVGNSTWGKIDYLTHYCGWFVSVQDKINKKVFNIDNDSYVDSKVSKRENKIKLVKEVKNIMKNVRK